MKIKLSINDDQSFVGEVPLKGFIGAHITLSDPDGLGSPILKASLSGHDVTDPKETKFMKWEFPEVNQNDCIRIQIQPDVQPDPPTSVSSSKSTETISTPKDQAKKILSATQACSETLSRMLDELRDELTKDEFMKVALGVGETFDTIYNSIDRKIYREHESLVPEQLKNMPKEKSPTSR